MAGRIRLFVLTAVAIVAGVVAALLVPKPLPEISRADFLAEVRAGHVHKIVVHDNATILAVSSTRGEFRTPYQPDDAELVTQLRASGVEVTFEDSGLGI